MLNNSARKLFGSGRKCNSALSAHNPYTSQTSMEGYLCCVCDSGSEEWSKWYFKLSGITLAYYKTPDAEFPLGVVDLKTLTGVQLLRKTVNVSNQRNNSSQKLQQGFCIELRGSQSNFRLLSFTKTTAEEWKDAIKSNGNVPEYHECEKVPASSSRSMNEPVEDIPEPAVRTLHVALVAPELDTINSKGKKKSGGKMVPKNKNATKYSFRCTVMSLSEREECDLCATRRVTVGCCMVHVHKEPSEMGCVACVKSKEVAVSLMGTQLSFTVDRVDCYTADSVDYDSSLFGVTYLETSKMECYAVIGLEDVSTVEVVDLNIPVKTLCLKQDYITCIKLHFKDGTELVTRFLKESLEKNEDERIRAEEWKAAIENGMLNMVQYIGYDVAEKDDEFDDQIWNYYKLMNVAKTASKREVKLAYVKQARKCHPGSAQYNPNLPPDAVKHFDVVSQAYQVLQDPTMRMEYNLTESVKSQLRKGVLFKLHMFYGAEQQRKPSGEMVLLIDSKLECLYFQPSNFGSVLHAGYRTVELRFVSTILAGEDCWNCPKEIAGCCLVLQGIRLPTLLVHMEMKSKNARDQLLDGLRSLRKSQSFLFQCSLNEVLAKECR